MPFVQKFYGFVIATVIATVIAGLLLTAIEEDFYDSRSPHAEAPRKAEDAKIRALREELRLQREAADRAKAEAEAQRLKREILEQQNQQAKEEAKRAAERARIEAQRIRQREEEAARIRQRKEEAARREAEERARRQAEKQAAQRKAELERRRELIELVRRDRCKAVSVCPAGQVFSLSDGDCILRQYYGGVIPGSENDKSFDVGTGRWVPNC